MKRLDSSQASSTQTGHACFMLAELYIEAPLVDEGLADLVWAAWDAEQIPDVIAILAWAQITVSFPEVKPTFRTYQ